MLEICKKLPVKKCKWVDDITRTIDTHPLRIYSQLPRLHSFMEKEALAFTGTPWTLIIQKSLAKDNNRKGRAMFFGKVQGNYNGKSNN